MQKNDKIKNNVYLVSK